MCIQTSLGQERSHGQKAMSHTNSENRPAENSLSSADRFCRSMRKGEEGDGPGRTLQLLRGICPLSWSSGWGADTWEAQRALHPVSGPQKSSAPGPRCLVNPEMKKSPASSPHHELSSWWTGLPSLLFGEPILDYAAGPTFVNLHAAGQWQPCTVTGQREKSRRKTAPAGGPPLPAPETPPELRLRSGTQKLRRTWSFPFKCSLQGIVQFALAQWNGNTFTTIPI